MLISYRQGYLGLFAIVSMAAGAELATPILDLDTQCRDVTISWPSVVNATHYRLWYRPSGQAPEADWQTWDVPAAPISAVLADGDRYAVSLQAIGDEETSDFAPTQSLRVGSFPIPPHLTVALQDETATVSWNAVAGSDGYRFWYQDRTQTDASWSFLDVDANTQSLTYPLWDGAGFRLTLQSLSGAEHSGFSPFLDVVVGDHDALAEWPWSGPLTPPPMQVAPHRPQGPYAETLGDCVYSPSRSEGCLLRTLPLIGQEDSEPSDERILQRLLVSHAWMGERFEQLLPTLPRALKVLFRSVTAIVIATDIRPSHYTSLTGAIYLDPGVLWMTQAEKQDVSSDADYRASCGDALDYRLLGRYVKDQDYAYASRYAEEDRTLDDVRYQLSALLFHELLHATDFFPAETLADLAPDQTTLNAAYRTAGRRPSDRLQQRLPLQSSLWKDHAQIRYHCQNSTCAQTAETPETMAAQMAGDQANAFYGYSTRFEDFAMLGEEFLMYRHFGLERDLAVTPVPSVSEPSGADFFVTWGQRRRIAETAIRPRLAYVLSRAYPGEDFSADLAALGEPIALLAGRDWLSNLAPSAGASARRSRLAPSAQPRDWLPPRH
jgi:hypothetical protein